VNQSTVAGVRSWLGMISSCSWPVVTAPHYPGDAIQEDEEIRVDGHPVLRRARCKVWGWLVAGGREGTIKDQGVL
jgi:hypothetical protein